MNRKQTTRNSASFLTGAGIGALAMYIFDPQHGTERRHRIGQATGGAMQSTRGTLSSTWEGTRERAKDLGQFASAQASSAGSRLADIGHRVSEQISHVGEGAGRISQRTGRQISGQAGQLAEYVTDKGSAKQARQISQRARQISEGARERLRELMRSRQFRKTQTRSSVNQTFLALGCVALGMGIMYALDPTAGRRRRAMARDRFRSSLGDVSTSMRKTSRDMWNRTTGLVSDLRHRTSHRQTSDAKIVERVRSEMGHCVSQPSAIEVTAHNGRVVLSGPIAAQEVDPLMKCVWAIPGVVELLNRLDIRQPVQAVSDLPGEQTGFTSPH